MIQLSKNEWDTLQSVIVGVADNAKIPELDTSLRCVNYADMQSTIQVGNYPQQVIDEANEDLNGLVKFLEGENVTVYRPDTKFVPEYYNYCPRDTVLVHDDLILTTPNPLRARQTEHLAMLDTLKDHGRVITKLHSGHENLYNKNCLGNPDILALNEIEPAFDAANILRSNDDLFYLVSNSGNKAGAKYLQELCPDKKVHTIEGVYSYMHLDSTIALLREGLMLLNPARIKSIDQLPKPLQSWDIIWAPEPVDIGHYPGYCNASTWVSINLFSVNPNLVIVEKHQNNLRKELEKYNIECAMLPMRHARTLGGCFHCVTLDLIRNHV